MKDQLKVIEENVRTALALLQIKDLISWLDKSGFFIAPASTNYHGNYQGGLIEHSWLVYDLLVKKQEYLGTTYTLENLITVGLLHDVCKLGMYEEDHDDATEPQIFRLQKECKKFKHEFPKKLSKQYASDLIQYYVGGAVGEYPEFKIGYKVNDQFPIGHGEKSVIVLLQHMPLEECEILAIRWHMGPFEPGVNFNFPTGYAYREAINKCPLATMLFTSDVEASNILEV